MPVHAVEPPPGEMLKASPDKDWSNQLWCEFGYKLKASPAVSVGLGQRAPEVPSYLKFFIIPGDVGNSRSNPKQQLSLYLQALSEVTGPAP